MSVVLAAAMVVGASLAAAGSIVLADQGEGSTMALATAQGHVTAGGLHTCAVLTTGSVQCWGNNDRGQLGTGTTTASTQPTTVGGITTAKAVAAGNTHTCVLLTDGTAKCWGLDGNGQVGDNSTGDTNSVRLSPLVVSGLAGAFAIASGGFHSCAITNPAIPTVPPSGAVKCWGDDGTGQLGDGTNAGAKSLVPVAVSGITNAVAVAAGEFHTCALLATNTVKCWGHNGFGQLGDGTTVDRTTPVAVVGLPDPTVDANKPVAITAGYGHTCVLLKGGSARCWGQNAYGQLGHSTPDANLDGVMDQSASPLTVQFNAGTPITPNIQDLSGMTALSAGQFHTCALIGAGSARCWGNNKRGQLGDGTTTNRTNAVVVVGLSGAGAVTAGGFHSCALVGSGMRCWGYNFYGQLGYRAPYSRVPVQVTTVTGASMVTAGTGFACALTAADTTNKPVCWGDNSNGRLGAGLSVIDSTIRVPVFGMPSADAIDAGNGQACALPAGSGSPLCWGMNTNGQLGDGTTTDRSSPVAVSGLTSATSVSAGGALGTAERGHTCAVRTDATVACWGRNANGQLGDGTTTDQTSPVTVQKVADPGPPIVLAPLTGMTSVVTGGFHSCALASDKTVWCWGFNGNGQLGDNSTAEHDYAVQVRFSSDPTDGPLSNVVALSAGADHTCAIINTGKTKCWGSNSNGQLGDGTTSDRQLPTAVNTIGTVLNPVNAITTGDFHTCARLGDDSLWCWGANGDGQLGDGTTTDNHAPEQIFGPASSVPSEARPVIRSISASRQNTCAVFVDTTIYCWGDNLHGQLGDGVGATSVSPVVVSSLGGSI